MILVNIEVPNDADGIELTRTFFRMGLKPIRATIKDGLFIAELPFDSGANSRLGALAEILNWTIYSSVDGVQAPRQFLARNAPPVAVPAMLTSFPKPTCFTCGWEGGKRPGCTCGGGGSGNPKTPEITYAAGGGGGAWMDEYGKVIPYGGAGAVPDVDTQNRAFHVHFTSGSKDAIADHKGERRFWLQDMWTRSQKATDAGYAPITNAELRRLLRLVITGAE